MSLLKGSSSGEKSGSRFEFQVKLERALRVWLYTTLSYSTHLIQSKEDLPFVPSDSCVMDKKPSEPASKKWQHHEVPAQRAPKLLQLLSMVCIQREEMIVLLCV